MKNKFRAFVCIILVLIVSSFSLTALCDDWVGIPISPDYLLSSRCVEKADEIIRENGWNNISLHDLAAEIYGHAIINYCFDNNPFFVYNTYEKCKETKAADDCDIFCESVCEVLDHTHVIDVNNGRDRYWKIFNFMYDELFNDSQDPVSYRNNGCFYYNNVIEDTPVIVELPWGHGNCYFKVLTSADLDARMVDYEGRVVFEERKSTNRRDTDNGGRTYEIGGNVQTIILKHSHIQWDYDGWVIGFVYGDEIDTSSIYFSCDY